MKKKFTIVLSVFLLLFVSACSSTTNEPPYILKLGAYEMKTAIFTNLETGEVVEMSLDDIFEDKNLKQWICLFGFSLGIDKNTEYIYLEDKRCYVLREGLAFEIVGENQLELHFPRWRSSDNQKYEIVVNLEWVPSYF